MLYNVTPCSFVAQTIRCHFPDHDNLDTLRHVFPLFTDFSTDDTFRTRVIQGELPHFRKHHRKVFGIRK
jgi:hypothetical protein